MNDNNKNNHNKKDPRRTASIIGFAVTMLIILLINIISRIPSDLDKLWKMFVSGKDVVHMTFAIVIILGALYYYLPWIAEQLGIG